MKTIQVSESVYKRLLSLASSFEDTPSDVIERLLDGKFREIPIAPAESPSAGADLVGSKGSRIPHGTKLRARYKGVEYTAEIQDGQVIWNGKRFSSVSRAAIAVIHSTGSHRPTENGWRFWEYYHEESEQWRPLNELRD